MNKQHRPRVITGSAKGLRLKVAATTRPVTDRMKQSLFDMLTEYITDAKVLDLYAGSGAFGIEALSRGASECLFVDISEYATEVIGDNLEHTKLEEQGTIIRTSVRRFLKQNRAKFDLIFCDPPFDNISEFALRPLQKLMHEDSLLILKLPRKYDLPSYKTMPILFEKGYGQNRLVILGKRLPV